MFVRAKTRGFYSLPCFLQLCVKLRFLVTKGKLFQQNNHDTTYYYGDEQERGDGRKAERDT